jgi:ParB family chromosome partitioning protein
MSARKRALGRGLDDLLGKEAPEVTSLPIERLRPNRLQPRDLFVEEDLDALVTSIRSQGIVQPLVVSPLEGDAYMIIAGERRWRAAQRAGLSDVPVVVRQVEGDRELLEMALVENLQREDLNPLEEARAYGRLQDDFGLSQEEIAGRVGKARTTISNTLRLLKLPEAIQRLLAEGSLTAGQARPLLAIEDRERQLSLARRAAAGKLNARQLEALATAAPGEKKKAPTMDPDTAAAAERLTRRLQTKVEIRRSGKGGTLRIAFHSEEALMRLFDILIEAGDRR